MALFALVAALGLVSPVDAEGGQDATATAARKPAKDPRKSQGLFVDPKMPAATKGAPYSTKIGSRAQGLWIIPEAYGTSWVRGIVEQYAADAKAARKTPMLTIYGIPGRDCGQYSSGNPLTTAKQYEAWIREITKGLVGEHALVVLEPDALPLFSSPVTTCPTKPAGWQKMLRFASKRLSTSGAWVYLDAGHSNWTPYDSRPAALKAAGVKFARGISTNVSNFRPTSDEKAYARSMLRGLKDLGITGKHYVIDTSRNGAKPSSNGYDVINPTWARIGSPPKLRFDGAYDGNLWVKHPGESDGTEHGGSSSGSWCNLLADRLLGRTPTTSYC